MTLAALELNDQALLMQAEDGTVHAEPGFARLAAGGVVTGEEARGFAWREPQHGYNQYWCHLNTTPLVARQKWARHNGDIAFAQLRSLWQGAGSPASLLLLPPGSWSDGQLSLLLGMVKVLPCTVRGVLDNALAACMAVTRPTLYVDLQLHQTVISRVSPGPGTVAIDHQEVFPTLGLLQVQNSVARHISHLLIDSRRYDPLHASESEQRIYDELPGWLARLCWQEEVSAVLESEHGDMPFILRNDAVRALLAERLVSVRAFLERHRGSQLLLSHASALLAGLSDEFADAEVAPQTVATEQALAHWPQLEGSLEGGLYRLREIPRLAAASTPVDEAGPLATHVLHGDQALPLSRPVSIRVVNGSLRMATELDNEATLTVVLRNRRLEALRQAPDAAAELPGECRPGAHIRVAGHELRLIEVRDA